MPQENNSRFPIFLRDAMRKREMTQAKLSKEAETSQSNISRYLQGSGMPRSEELLRISKALGVTMEWLLTGETRDGSPPQPVSNSLKTSRQMKAAMAQIEKAVADLRKSIQPDEPS